jgi:hypothetical protein
MTIYLVALLIFATALLVGIIHQLKVDVPRRLANARNKKLAFTSAGSIAVCLVLFAGFWGNMVLTAQLQERSERTWSTTTGVIQSSAVVSSVYVTRGGTTYTSWSPYWTYSFIVHGQKFDGTSNRIPFGYNANWYSSSASAEADAQSMPVGSIVAVYCDPADPQKSVLDKRPSSPFEWAFLIFPVLSLGMAGQLFWAIYQVRRKLKASGA